MPVIQVMCYGHIVDAEEVSRVGDRITFRFLCHHASGAKSLCLDYGAGINITEGQPFTATQAQIDRAAQWLKELMPSLTEIEKGLPANMLATHKQEHAWCLDPVHAEQVAKLIGWIVVDSTHKGMKLVRHPKHPYWIA